jgi:two-component system, LuxR family, response regulator FixJ
MAADRMVHVIDDDAAIRDSLSFLLNAAGLDVRTYESAGAFLSALPPGASGCIVTDVSMPEMSGVDLLRRLRDLNVQLPVIVITGHGDIQLAVEAMKLGAKDFIEKPIDDETLLASINSALDAGRKHAEEDAERAALLTAISSLTDRERDVLEGLVAGKPNKIIAFDLGISARTVEIYRANVMTKMEANSLAELVRMALLAGLSKIARDDSR